MTRFDDWAANLDPESDGPPLDPADAAVVGRIGEILGDEATWAEPPPSLKGRLLAEAAVERAGGDPLGRPADLDPTSAFQDPSVDGGAVPPGQAPGADDGTVISIADGSTPARARARARWLGPALAAVAAASVAAIALFAWPRVASDVDTVDSFEVAGTELAPDASARVDVEAFGSGVAITLHITGLAPAPEGQYYAGWLTGDEGMVGIGSFHWREGGFPIELWSGVDVERYPNLGITLQTEGEPPTSSGRLVFKGLLVDDGD